MNQIMESEKNDVISGISLAEVDKQMIEFEINLFHPDIGMLIGISKNQKQKITDPTTIIGKKGEEVASIYYSILSLHSMSRRPNLTYQYLEKTLYTFNGKLHSELPKLLEIIQYIYDTYGESGKLLK